MGTRGVLQLDDERLGSVISEFQLLGRNLLRRLRSLELHEGRSLQRNVESARPQLGFALRQLLLSRRGAETADRAQPTANVATDLTRRCVAPACTLLGRCGAIRVTA
jgi:hypothetical protein